MGKEKMNRITKNIQVAKTFLQGRVPGQLVIQYTDLCNAQCPQCGMRASNDFPRTTLGVERTKEIIATAAEKGFAALSFTGGEPFLHLDEVCALSCYADQQGIDYIRTGTNGYLFAGSDKAGFSDKVKRLADKLAATPIRNIWVSIDSSDPQVHEQMRGLPGVIRGIEKALPLFAERGIYLSANLGINRNFAGRQEREELDADFFRAGFDRFYRYVADLGFSIANVCYPMWSEPEQADTEAVYAATTSDQITYFSHVEKLALFSALFETIPQHRQRLRIFTPRASLHALLNQYRGEEHLSSSCRGGIDFFFVDSADGNTYPCGYRGEENLGPFEQLEMKSCAGGDDCRRCDWECFRDPSELFAPMTALRTTPLKLLQRLRQDPEFIRLWWEDLRYYRACHYFNGRMAPSSSKLRDWELQGAPVAAIS
ncbi:Radical SAM superfamily enzyme, MoaA/NifB/PqqE/SkfB family [Malonomonas rubra DSM 5091]|uniref:Radical SAM superfamily enzyme, MoaA/NifB/PqqE/SkfB family n=1 Tax=Malonomonas rubra DSM 5091 TaxID=1122189 RepID=A0A1M6H5H6_MALRU|nr:radical SAM protein [Malonomonas rubra]SHJ17426.1 Radical SAM superfamily enzyme, MoaA/NifB/PqqE/SkfB family [Malonomonas rubra DSM 5091]